MAGGIDIATKKTCTRIAPTAYSAKKCFVTINSPHPKCNTGQIEYGKHNKITRLIIEE